MNLTRPHANMDQDFRSGVIWIFKGFLYPCWSWEFYKQAISKRTIVAVLFIFLFAFAQSSVATIRVALIMNNVGNEIKLAYESGKFPNIIIEDGFAKVDGNDPYVFSDNRQFLAIDTTGSILEIDTRAYSQGFLLTETDIHLVDEDGYQILPLTDLHAAFGNPIVIDKSQVIAFWDRAALVIDLVVFIGIFIWTSLVRFAFVALLGLIVWGIVSLIRQGTGFSPILITGIYANVLTTYMSYILKQIGFSFWGFNSILLIVIWSIVLRFVFKADNGDRTVAKASATFSIFESSRGSQ